MIAKLTSQQSCRRMHCVVLVSALSLLAVGSLSQHITVLADSDLNAYQNTSRVFGGQGDAVVLLHPGMLLDPTFDFGNVSHQATLATFLNKSVRPQLLFEPTGFDIGRIYSEVLTTAEWSTVPLVVSQRAELKAIRQRLLSEESNEPLPAYKLYLDLKARYETLQAAFDQTPVNQRTAEKRNDLQEARNDLRLRGRENTIKPLHTRYKALLQQASLQWRDLDIQRMNQATVSHDQPFYRTTIFPQFDDERLDWIPVQLTHAQLNNPPSVPGVAGEHNVPGWWRWGVASVPGPEDHFESLTTDDFTLSFEYAQVLIQRDWLDWNLFESPAWRFRDNRLISDGLDHQNTGIAPSVMVGLVLVRNVRLSGDAVRGVTARMRAAVRAKHCVGFGPIKLAGDAEGPVPIFIAPTIYQSQIQISQPQVTAVAVRVLPKSPRPNNDFEWPQQ